MRTASHHGVDATSTAAAPRAPAQRTAVRITEWRRMQSCLHVLVILAAGAALLSACRGNKSPSAPSSVTAPSYVGLHEGGSFEDAQGDAQWDFIDLRTMTVSVTDQRVTVNLSVTALPTELPYNQPLVSDRSLEYRWAVNFDVNGDSARLGDIQLNLSKFKFGGSQLMFGPILAFVQAYVLKAEEGGRSTTLRDSFGRFIESDAIVSASTITLSVPKNAHFEFRAITRSTRLYFETFRSDGVETGRDYYPDR